MTADPHTSLELCAPTQRRRESNAFILLYLGQKDSLGHIERIYERSAAQKSDVSQPANTWAPKVHGQIKKIYLM